MTLAAFYVHTATVEQYLGSGAGGPQYAAGTDIPCFIDARELLTMSSAGQEVTQRASVLYCDTSYAALLAPLSRVTSAQLGGDDTALVQSLNVLDSGSLGLPDHIEAVLL